MQGRVGPRSDTQQFCFEHLCYFQQSDFRDIFLWHLKGDKVVFFSLSYFFPFLPLQSDLSGLSPRVSTPQSLINSVHVAEGGICVLLQLCGCLCTRMCVRAVKQQLWAHQEKSCHTKLVMKMPAINKLPEAHWVSSTHLPPHSDSLASGLSITNL